MADGTYADEDPNAGILDRVVSSVGKVIKSVAPHSVTDIEPRTNSNIDKAAGDSDKIGRMKQAQSSDRDNSYSY